MVYKTWHTSWVESGTESECRLGVAATDCCGTCNYANAMRLFLRLVGTLFLVGYVLVVGSGIIAGSSALNALSDHAACTVW